MESRLSLAAADCCVVCREGCRARARSSPPARGALLSASCASARFFVWQSRRALGRQALSFLESLPWVLAAAKNRKRSSDDKPELASVGAQVSGKQAYPCFPHTLASGLSAPACFHLSLWQGVNRQPPAADAW